MGGDFLPTVLAGVIATVGGGLILRLLLRPEASAANEGSQAGHPVLRRFLGILFVLSGFIGGIIALLSGQFVISMFCAVIFILGHAMASTSR